MPVCRSSAAMSPFPYRRSRFCPAKSHRTTDGLAYSAAWSKAGQRHMEGGAGRSRLLPGASTHSSHPAPHEGRDMLPSCGEQPGIEPHGGRYLPTDIDGCVAVAETVNVSHIPAWMCPGTRHTI